MRRLAPALFTVVSAFALAPPGAAADLTIVSKTRFGSKEGTQTVFLTPDRMKTSSGSLDSIVEFSSGQMTFSDGEKKTFYVTSFGEMAAYAKRREELAKASSYNAQAFGALGDVVATKTGRTRRIAGIPCAEWVFAMGKTFVSEVCAAGTLPVPGPYFEARKAAYAGMGPMGRHFERMFDTMRKVPGYPLSLALHVKTEAMKQASLTEATDVRTGDIPAGTFAVPADYTKKKSPFAP